MANSSEEASDPSPKTDALLEALLRAAPTAASGKITRRQAAGPAPLSFAQQRLWFLDQVVPGNPAYNVLRAFGLTGQLDTAVLEKSLAEIVRCHESLRTTFTAVEGRPVQMVQPVPGPGHSQRQLMPLFSRVIDLRRLPEPEQGGKIHDLLTKESRRTFDLTRGPLMRMTLLRLGEEEHVLLLVMHHIVSDGWSVSVLLRELAALYAAFSTGASSPLPPLPIQYADFALWQRQWLQGEVLENQLAYWKKQLAGAPFRLELPTDRPRPSVQTYGGARQSMVVSKALTEGLKALSRREGVTLFMTLLAAFKTLLYRYSGQEDITVGSPIANRNRVEIESVIGFFVNTLALRTDLTGNPSFQGLVHRVRKVALEAYAHQDLPFEKLVEELQPERNLSHSPLFQVMFVLHNQPMPTLEFSNVTLSPMEVDNGTAKFDLTLSASEGREGLQFTWEYNTHLFDHPTVGRMLGHFHILLQGIVADPGQPIGLLPLLTEAEGHQLLVEWNDTQADCPQDRCVHHLFEAQAERRPDAVAMVFREEQMTYGELNCRANRLARYLRKLGVGPKVLVGVCLERSLEMVVGLLAVLKAGGAYVPLDPSYPEKRLAFMLEETEAPVLLSKAHLTGKLPRTGAKVVCLDRDWDVIAREPGEVLFVDTGPSNLAYVIYTSGSTGKPKGVEVEHRGLVNLVSWLQRTFSVSEKDQTAHLASLSFDVSVMELWSYLTAGARISFPPDEERRTSPLGLRDWLLSEEISVSALVTPLAELVLPLSWPETAPLRVLMTAGDKLSSYPSKTLPFQFLNAYGPTEYTVLTTWAAVGPNQESYSPPPIGRPIANTQVYLLDKHLQPVPVGVPGELYVGGVGLARGYLKRPELTAEKFIPNPFGNDPGSRLYRTGDLARYLPDGNIEFLGRMDGQVKIRGFRVEPGEIETILGQHPAVKKVVVLARQRAPNRTTPAADKHLVAYVVPHRDNSLAIDELRRFLKERLPGYMVPSAFVLLHSLPLTPNGKVDRSALPLPEPTRPDLNEAFIAPRTAVEELVAGVWSEVLRLDRVGVQDNFFELGGHSLLAVQVLSRLRRVFQADLPLRCLFEAPTVAELSQVIMANEPMPGQTEKIARAMGKIKKMSSDDMSKTLEEIRRQRGIGNGQTP